MSHITHSYTVATHALKTSEWPELWQSTIAISKKVGHGILTRN